MHTAHPVEQDWHTWLVSAKNPALQLDTQSLLLNTRGTEHDEHEAPLLHAAQRDAHSAHVRSDVVVHVAV